MPNTIFVNLSCEQFLHVVFTYYDVHDEKSTSKKYQKSLKNFNTFMTASNAVVVPPLVSCTLSAPANSKCTDIARKKVFLRQVVNTNVPVEDDN